MLRDAVARDGGAQDEPFLPVEAQRVELGDVLEIDEELGVAAVLADLHDDVGAAGQRPRAVPGEQSCCLGQRRRSGVVDVLHHCSLRPGKSPGCSL
jgi:hypothetical protein